MAKKQEQNWDIPVEEKNEKVEEPVKEDTKKSLAKKQSGTRLS